MDVTFLYLIVLASIFAVTFAIIVKKGWIMGIGNPRTNLDKIFVYNKWQEIEALMKEKKPSASKTAIVEADKLVDYVLKSKVGSNGTMGERLKKARDLFPKYSDYDNLWKAHKMRNRLVHESDIEIFSSQIKETISSYKEALKVLRTL